MTNPIAVAIQGKGPLHFLRRGMRIASRYGATPDKLHRALAQLETVLERFECRATFPITAVALQRHSHRISEHQARGIEFAIHGYRHIDHSRLSQVEQIAQLALARRIFAQAGIQAQGFRSPYLRWNPDTVSALQAQGLAYDSSQALAWDVLDGRETPAYRQALSFYGALSAHHYPSLPRLERGLVRIPYSLPDDEALVERLSLDTPAQMSELWLEVLRRTFELGELFTVGLHPERASLCQEALVSVLEQARSLSPSVWIARLDEIAAWWRARALAVVQIADAGDGALALRVDGPAGTVVLTRAVQVDAPTALWAGGYYRVRSTSLVLRAPLRPWIGVSRSTSLELSDWLRQQGYIVEISEERQRYSCYLDPAEFTASQERALLDKIESGDFPLVRLGRWPNGARSALAITGDIDALTLWDYGLRFLGR